MGFLWPNGVSRANCWTSEVYKARSKKDNSVLALKKILMHHEKEGVCFTCNLPPLYTPADLLCKVPDYRNSRDQDFEGAFSSKCLAAQRDGR